MLSKDRTFYDLCRKYKYYYKSYKEVEKLEGIYWSKYVQEAYKEVKEKLDEVENEIMHYILNHIINENSMVKICRDRIDDRFPLTKSNMKTKVIIYDDDFADKIDEYLNKYRRFWY